MKLSVKKIRFEFLLRTHVYAVKQKCFAELSLVTFQLCNFWCLNIGSKCAGKMLMKLTQDVRSSVGFPLSITNILFKSEHLYGVILDV